MQDMALIDNFRHNLREAMETATPRLTNAELARRSGIHYVTVSRIVTGKLAPSVDTCERLAKAAGLRPDTVFLEPTKKTAASA